MEGWQSFIFRKKDTNFLRYVVLFTILLKDNIIFLTFVDFYKNF